MIIIGGKKTLYRRKGVRGKKETKMQKAKRRRGKPQGALFISSASYYLCALQKRMHA